MRTIEHYPEEKKKITELRGRYANEQANMIQEVDGYLESQVSSDESLEQVKRRYLREYIDILDSPAVQPLHKGHKHKPLSLKQKMALIKREIYLHEILPKRKMEEKTKIVH